MRLRPFSSRERGMFISIDGPSGAGKSTIVRHLAQRPVAAGENVNITAEPSNGPIGVLCRELTDSAHARQQSRRGSFLPAGNRKADPGRF
jgi:dTMP kinase